MRDVTADLEGSSHAGLASSLLAPALGHYSHAGHPALYQRGFSAYRHRRVGCPERILSLPTDGRAHRLLKNWALGGGTALWGDLFLGGLSHRRVSQCVLGRGGLSAFGYFRGSDAESVPSEG